MRDFGCLDGWLPSDWLLFGKMDWELGLIRDVVEKLWGLYMAMLNYYVYT